MRKIKTVHRRCARIVVSGIVKRIYGRKPEWAVAFIRTLERNLIFRICGKNDWHPKECKNWRKAAGK